MTKRFCTGVLTAFMFCILASGTVHAQVTDIGLQVELESELTASEIIELSKVATGERSLGNRLLTVYIQNNGNLEALDLYLDLSFSSNQEGLMWENYQIAGIPFSLKAGQSVFLTNDDLAKGTIKGLAGNLGVDFEGKVTEHGHIVLNQLRNQTTPPTDYTLEVGIYQLNNRQNGGRKIAQTSHSVTLAASSQQLTGSNSLFLIAPGDHVDARIPNISNPYPEFRWDGGQDQTYRVVIVEREPRESPEDLIQSARGTQADLIGKSVNLLDFEKADILVKGTSFQYPANGVAPLQNGKQYFWQVFATADLEQASEIWSFRLTGGPGLGQGQGRGIAGLNRMEEELREILIALLGTNTVRELERENYKLLDIELDGRQYKDEMAIEELRRLIEKIREEKAKINKPEIQQ